MPDRPHLTDRDLEILVALTHRVRVLTAAQIARTWWATSTNPEQNAIARLRILQGDGFLRLERVPAHLELDLKTPEVSWKPGGRPPDFGAVSYRLQSRWKQHPIITVCVSGTRIAADRFEGHGGRPPRQVERTHDIHLAGVYLIYQKRYPDGMSGWIFEEELRRDHRQRRERLPDVIFENRGYRKVVEFGGAYPKAKLQAFHSYCREQNLPYEVW